MKQKRLKRYRLYAVQPDRTVSPLTALNLYTERLFSEFNNDYVNSAMTYVLDYIRDYVEETYTVEGPNGAVSKYSIVSKVSACKTMLFLYVRLRSEYADITTHNQLLLDRKINKNFKLRISADLESGVITSVNAFGKKTYQPLSLKDFSSVSKKLAKSLFAL